jgi:hypothetical protein
MMMRDEASFMGFFPHRKARAGRSPRFDYLGVWPRVRADPFKQVEDQSVYGVRHGSLLSGRPEGSTIIVRLIHFLPANV